MSDKCYNIIVRSSLFDDDILKHVFHSFRNQIFGMNDEYSIDYVCTVKNNEYSSYVSMDLYGDIKPGIGILGEAGGRDRSIFISGPDEEELSHIRNDVSIQLKCRDNESSDVYISKIESINGKYFFGIRFKHDVIIPNIFPFKFLEDKNMYRMVIDIDQFYLTDAEALSIASHPESAYVVYNTPATMGEYRYLGPGGIDKYADVDASTIFGAVYHIEQIDARADDTDPDEIDARILVVTFDVFDRENLTTQHLKERPGDFILKPRMVGNKFVCFDLIRTNAYTDYTLIEKSEDNVNDEDNLISEGSD